MVVADVVGAVAFLRDVFGAAGEVGDLARPVRLELGDSTIVISAVGERKPFPVFPYVDVEDADAVYGRAISAGAHGIEEPVDAPWGDRRAMVEDPDGNVVQIAGRPRATTGP